MALYERRIKRRVAENRRTSEGDEKTGIVPVDLLSNSSEERRRSKALRSGPYLGRRCE